MGLNLLSRLGRWLLLVVVGGGGLAVGLALLSGQARDFLTAGTVGNDDRASVRLAALPARSVVYATDGSVLDLLHAEENRVPITLSRVPPHVVRAVLDAEDERFFDHGALDPRALGRAVVANVSAGEVSEGGSTITQQLVKTELLSSRQDMTRKVQEAALAIRLENRMSKHQILERYLNAVYFGNGAYGLEAAAERYFNVGVEQLTRGQGVLLAGLIRNPVFADPFSNPIDAGSRRDAIIERMVVLGRVDRSEADALEAEPLPTRPPDLVAPSTNYFATEVRNRLLNDPRLGATEAERYQAVFKGGLAIHTTLEPRYQRAAERSIADIVPDTKGRFTAALVSVDPTSGAVRALVGGAGFGSSQVNLTDFGPGRQTGSSFKTFTLLAALEEGYSPDDLILGSAPCPVPNPAGTPDPWSPDNVEGQAAGVLTLADATVRSVNCAYARLVKLVGPEKVVDIAHRMGITSPLQSQLSIALGAQEVTPLQMASAYATLAADGLHHSAYLIDRVEDRNGKLIFENAPKAERAVSSDVARTATQVLTQAVARGTGRAASIRRWTAAGKTGSTDNNVDAWFVGFTPKLSTAVWMGSPAGQVSMYNVGGVPRVYGGTFPARIWSAYTAGALADQAPVFFQPPEHGPKRSPRFLFPLMEDVGDFKLPDDQMVVLPGGGGVLAGDSPVELPKGLQGKGDDDDNSGDEVPQVDGTAGTDDSVPADDPATDSKAKKRLRERLRDSDSNDD
ncbi:MAG: transglycosylase domain-containing protein [Acidimicrobiales bacterium]